MSSTRFRKTRALALRHTPLAVSDQPLTAEQRRRGRIAARQRRRDQITRATLKAVKFLTS